MLLNEKQIIREIYRNRKKFKNGNLEKQIKDCVPISFWQSEESCSTIKKRKLIEMAKKGEPRPQDKKTTLGIAFFRYIRKTSESYDADFKKRITLIRPDWLLTSFDIHKEKLLKLAKQGKPRPNSKKNNLGTLLLNYIVQGRSGYDAMFARQIKKLVPHWFVKTVDKKKSQLIDMAMQKKPKPNGNGNMKSLRNALYSYTQKSNRCYDPAFDKRIRKLAPHWF